MYKIYINETPLILATEAEVKELGPASENEIIVPYRGKAKYLLNYIDTLEKSRKFSRIILYYKELDELWKDFKSLYKLIEAAGGLVENEHEELLFIHRLGFWDLPKGKIDKGEEKEAAAVREVEEETGLAQIVLGEPLKTTYHTYRNRKDKRVLKRTYWYKMKAPSQELTPQTEENIELAVWMSAEAFWAEDRKVYKNILEVLKSAKS